MKMTEVRVYSTKQKIPKDIFKVDLNKEFPELNPINIGPCMLYKGRQAKNLHNAWEYTKVYKEHTENGQITTKYWDWATKGWDKDKPAKSTKKKYLYHFWDGARYGVIEARRRIFVSKYIRLISNMDSYRELKNIASNHEIVAMISKHGFDHKQMSLTEVLFNPAKEFDYSFVLAMLISKDQSLTDIP
ncbi:MAG: hypothetical protein GF411_01755 [Candidatus Lokiarchaeota archaeon]|nr:hypothetical protein [Candidatus Lokiarchaeota archaeon]